MKLYIATPINGRREETFAVKFEAAQARVQELKEQLRANPKFAKYTQMTSGVDVCPLGAYTEAKAVGRCVQAVLESDAVYMDMDYERSKGCLLEYDTCYRYKIPVFGANWEMNWEE